MNKAEKFLTDKGILYEADDEADDFEVMKGAEYDWCRKLVEITDQFIITVFYSAVLDPEIHLFDRNTFQLIATQNLYPDNMSFMGTKNQWCSYMQFE